MWLFILLPWLFTGPLLEQDEPARPLYRVVRSSVTFTSTAPLETITATNRAANGLLDLNERTFALRVPIVDFHGFNAPLQREHFNENYMAGRIWPNAQFKGRIIEAADLTGPGTYPVRAKGMLTIHGVERERIIPCRLVVDAGGIRVTTTMDVALADHDIRIPRVVEQKIASVVQVDVDLLFEPQAMTR